MAKRLIYAEDALDLIDQNRAFMSDVGRIHARNAVNEAPTVEQKKGRWEKYARYMICSECDIGFCYYKNETHRFRYCPHCGADMRGGEDG